MSEPFLGEIKVVPYNFAPRGWARCDGQLMAISQNTALFSLLGTTYGGNGVSNFGLPDLRGRRPYHVGQGPGLSLVDLGEMAGEESVTLLQNEIPSHTHSVRAVRGAAGVTAPSTSPAGAAWANEVLGTPQNKPYAPGQPNVQMSPSAVGLRGSSFPHNNLPPYLVLTYVIALQGIFPPRP
jgi:microcystin-dependent protein